MLFTTSVFGRSDALVVGVEIYQESTISPLLGVRHDIQNIKTVLQTLNVPKSHIQTLKKHRATLYNVRQAFKKYIFSTKNHENNLFIFYFSGHGLQVADVSGDETDGLDEASVLYDASTKDGYISNGILLDDELYTLLSHIKSKKVLIFDKCHSDSSYRDVAIPQYEKVLKGTFKLSSTFISEMKALPNIENSVTNIITLSASQDKEIAEDSPLGGLFTQSLLQGVVYKKAGNHNSMTLEVLENFCNDNIYTLAKNIRKNFKGADKIKGAFHPRFRPNKVRNSSLATIFNIRKYQPIKEQNKKRKTPISEYLLEDTLDKMSNNQNIKSKLLNGKKIYYNRESVSVKFKPKQNGYLNVLVARKDTYKIFTEKTIKIKANKSYIFPENFYKSRALRAKKPFGKTKIYLVLSRQPLNISQYINSLKSNDLGLNHSFTKELVPSAEFYYNQKKKRQEFKKLREPNILGVSRVVFDVRR